MRQGAIYGALIVVAVGVTLGATVFRTDIAQATGLAPSVTVNNTPANAVPVREQNLDGNGNIKVHEQGALRVEPEAPIVSGGSGVSLPAGNPYTLSAPATATALSIRMTATVQWVQLSLEGSGGGPGALFYGPFLSGNTSIVLALTRPLKFDVITCAGSSDDRCSVSWVGNQP